MGSRATGFLVLNLLLASGLMVAPWTGVFIGDIARAARGQGPLREGIAHLESFAILTIGVAATLFAVTMFDVYGITLLARTRGWRLPRPISWTVCAHASAGWLLSGILPLLFMANYYVLNTLVKLPFTGRVTDAAGLPRVSWQWVLGVGLPVLGYLSGLVAFELIALCGARVCRYANLPLAEAPPAPA
jgi:hypothetical protein